MNAAIWDRIFFLTGKKLISSFQRSTISIIGTGKRIGKTAISSYIAKLFSEEDINVAILAMGRGGPKNHSL